MKIHTALILFLYFKVNRVLEKHVFFEHIALNNRYFGEGKTIDVRDKDTKIQATSKWICELGEIGSNMTGNSIYFCIYPIYFSRFK